MKNEPIKIEELQEKNYAGKSLAIQGEKHVQVAIKSVNATTHSYTI
jgi:hypothetical protein